MVLVERAWCVISDLCVQRGRLVALFALRRAHALCWIGSKRGSERVCRAEVRQFMVLCAVAVPEGVGGRPVLCGGGCRDRRESWQG